MRSKKTFALLLMISLLTASLYGVLMTAFHEGDLSNFNEETETDETIQNPFDEISYTPHDPIWIVNDADFASQASTNSWPGNGSDTNPYIIENYEIHGPIYDPLPEGETLIEIVSTTYHFVVQNCLLDGDGQRRDGVVLLDVTHGNFSNNIIRNCRHGVLLRNSEEIIIEKNYIHDHSESGIRVFNSRVTISENVIYSNFFNGIWLEPGYGVEILSNYIFQDTENGILIDGRYNPWHYIWGMDGPSHSHIISGNEINDTETGIYLYSEQNAVYNIAINNNYLHDIEGTGISLCYAYTYSNHIESNQIVNCRIGVGIYNTHRDLGHDIIANTIYGTHCAILINGSSYNHQISNNQIASPSPGYSNTYGIYFADLTAGTDILNNTLCRNEFNAIFHPTGGGHYLTLRYNNFIQNNLAETSQAYIGGVNTVEYNFWDEWTSPDVEPDGIVDLPYNYEGGQDLYPLAQPSEPLTCHYLNRINVTYPNGGESIGGIVTVNWTSVSCSLGHDIEYDIWFSSDAGSNWDVLTEGVLTAEYDWDTSLLSVGSNYMLNVDAHCSEGLTVSDTSDDVFSIIPPPIQWVQTPKDQIVPLNEPFRYDLNATTGTSIEYWWLVDSTYFTIDQDGVITNTTVLDMEEYEVHVFVNDTAENVLSAQFKVMVDFVQSHGTIVITSDADFASQALSEEWAGDGSAGDPYIIEYYEIDTGGSSTHCINISNTRVHFTIRKCRLTGSNISPGFGINLDNVTYGLIFDNKLYDNFINIYIWDSHNVIVKQNLCYDSVYSISLRQFSSYNTISDNNCSVNDNRGLNLESSSHHNLIINNTCNNNTYGIVLYQVTYNDVINNTFNFNGNDGIHLRASYCNLENNTCVGNYHGVYTQDTNHHNEIINNVFEDNNRGILFRYSTVNTVTNNSFTGNVVGVLSEATSISNVYTWNTFSNSSVMNCYADNSETFDYNYWSDYTGLDEDEDGIGDTPFTVPGTGSNQDPHPLMRPPDAPVIWKEALIDVWIYLDEVLYLDLNVTGKVDYWWINDTRFNIDSLGIITNSTILSAGIHPLTVSVHDIFGNVIYGCFSVQVVDPDTPRDAIIIDGDSEFASTVLYERWSGDGSLGSPYIIENLRIDQYGVSGHCISISNTRVYFIIRFCVLSNASMNPGSGIFLNNVTNGVINNNTCAACYNGITLDNSSLIHLFNNTCTQNANVGIYLHRCTDIIASENTCKESIVGIYLYNQCEYNTLIENTCSDNIHGIFLREANTNILAKNNCSDNGNRGICLEWSHYNNVTDNDCDSNGAFGIVLYYSDHNNVLRNSFDSNGNEGVHHRQSDYNALMDNSCDNNQIGMNVHEDSDYNLVQNNTCDFNENYGFLVASSLYNRLTNNTFRYNDYGLYITAQYTNVTWNDFTDNIENCFDDGTSNIIDYNHWSDYTGTDVDGDGIGDTPHSIYGNSDSHPIMSPSGMNLIWLEPLSDQDVDEFVPFRYDINASALPPGLDFWWINTTTFEIDQFGVVTNNTILAVGTYCLQVFVNDTQNNVLTGIFTVTVRDIYTPTWLHEFEDYTLEYGLIFIYDVNATDNLGLDTWWLNNTQHFVIDNDGVITSTGIIPIGEYHLQVWVNDSSDNTITGIFTLNVSDTQGPTWVDLPTIPVVEYGTHFVCDANATDPSGIDDWWINNTAQFIIGTEGHIYMTVELEPGDYPLTVYVNDVYGHTTSADIIVQVRDTTPPEWTIGVTDQHLEYEEDLSYQLIADDLSGISSWAVNDTTNFHISESGLVTNIVPLSPGQYGLLISVYDPSGNELTATFTVYVSSISTTTITSTTVTSTTTSSITTSTTSVTTTTTSSTTTETTPTSTTTSTTPTTPPGDSMIIIIIGLGVGGVVVVIIIIIIIRKKG